MNQIDVKIIAPFFDATGISQVAREIALALYDNGIEIQIVDLKDFSNFKIEPDIEEKQKLNIMQQFKLNNQYIAIHMYPPTRYFNMEDKNAKANVFWHLYETDRIPYIWRMIFNQKWIKEVWVPSEFNKATFIKSNVEQDKIKIVNFGVNTTKYNQDNQKLFTKENGSFYFSFISELKICKGFDLLLRAFYEEFVNEPSAKLIFKCSCMNDQNTINQISNLIKQFKGNSKAEVILIAGTHPEEYMTKLYATGDCFVLPTRGEGWGLCLGPDTILHTKQNVCKIKDVKRDMEILSLDGKYHKILDKTSRQVNEYYEIDFRGSLKTLVTKEHPFYTTKCSLRQYNLLKEKPKMIWENIQNLKEKDLVCVPKPKYDNILPEFLNISDFVNGDNIKIENNNIFNKMGFSPDRKMSYLDICNKYNTTKKIVENSTKVMNGIKTVNSIQVNELIAKLNNDKDFKINVPLKIKNKIKINDEFLEFCGWYLAEGSLENGNRINIDLHKKEMHVAKKLESWINNNLNATNVVCEYNGINKCRLRFSSSIFAEFLNKIFGQHSHDKYIPWFIENAGNKLGPLIRGMFLGDGHFDENTGTVTFSTISKDLAIKVRDILLSNNIFSSIKFYDNEHDGKFVLQVSREHVNLFTKFIGIRRWNYKNSSKRFIEEKDCFLVPITKILKVNKKLQVYDICVENIHNFVANGVLVHNTIIQSMACGIPAITSNCSAQTTFCNEKNTLLIDAPQEKIRNIDWLMHVPIQDSHEWFEPNYIQLKKQMRYAFENKDKLAEKGKIARMDVEKFDWNQIVIQVVQAIKKYN